MSAAPESARLPITIAVMMASTMTVLDSTIANVALPHMAGSVSASQEQIAWVLTSYIVATAMITPLTGWLSAHIGRKRLLLGAVVGFTVASMLCGLSNNVPEIVAFRFLQGAFGAPLTPLSQAVMLDTYPPEKHGQAMAMWGMGTLMGPIVGPILGGFLTDALSWRWVFFINLPLGILAAIGCWLFISNETPDERRPFDFMGYAALVAFMGALQLMLDRGPSLDWFAAGEIWAYLVLAAIALWVFIIHTLTVRHPFFDRRLMTDRNFVAATIFGFGLSTLLFSSTALLPGMLQGLMGYPALASGLLTVPRGIGALTAIFVVGRLANRINTRLLLGMGLTLTMIAASLMSHFDLSMGGRPLVFSGVLQGLGLGMMFVPMNVVAYATVPLSLRAEASAVNNIVRNMGASAGISVMQALVVANTQAAHEGLAAHLSPADPVVRAGLSPAFDPGSLAGLTALNGEVTRQATMIAYLNDFRLMILVAACCLPLLLLVRPSRARVKEMGHAGLE
jgi:DHA2 family multidrug resistance protein